MRYPSILALSALSSLFTGCVDVAGGASAASVPVRTGPPFAVAFPDPSVLLTTEDIDATRALLDTIPLPETQEHHDALTTVLNRASSVDSEHLVLLTEAVALPHRRGNFHADKLLTKSVRVSTVDGKSFVRNLGKSEFSHVVDDLLISGARKLSDVGPSSLGLLIGTTLSDGAILELSNLLLSQSDDGTEGALETILAQIPFPDIRKTLCLKVLLPRDALQGARADIALRSMSFDSNRTELAAAIYAALDSLDPETLLRHTRMQSFDEGRIQMVKLGAVKLREIGSGAAVAIVETTHFDSGRTQVLASLKPKLQLTSAADALAFVKLNAFDSGRTSTLKNLIGESFPAVTESGLQAIASTGKFDSGRLELITILRPKFDGKFTLAGVEKILRCFSFDTARMRFLETFRDELQALPEEDRRKIAQSFTFSSERENASDLLAR